MKKDLIILSNFLEKRGYFKIASKLKNNHDEKTVKKIKVEDPVLPAFSFGLLNSKILEDHPDFFKNEEEDEEEDFEILLKSLQDLE